MINGEIEIQAVDGIWRHIYDKMLFEITNVIKLTYQI